MDKRILLQLDQEYAKFKNASKYNLDSEEVFCICRRPDNGELMVACDGCDEWFHFKCMGIDTRYKDLVNNYYCKFCDTLLNKGKSVWKRKCKLQTCFKPIQPQSQFCSQQHGIDYWSFYLEQFSSKGTNLGEIGKLDVINVIQSVNNRSQLEDLGSTLPPFDKGELEITAEQRTLVSKAESDIKANEKSIEILQLKVKYLQQLKVLVSQVNEFLSKSLDPDNQKNEDETMDGTEKNKKKGKRNQKAKRFKIDICGYNSSILLPDKEWLEFTQTDRFRKLIEFQNLSDTEKSLIAKFYENYTNENDVILTDAENSSILSSICLKEKRKCQLHNGWFNIIFNDLDVKIIEKNVEIDTKTKLMQDINKSIQVHSWKVYCNDL